MTGFPGPVRPYQRPVTPLGAGDDKKERKPYDGVFFLVGGRGVDPWRDETTSRSLDTEQSETKGADFYPGYSGEGPPPPAAYSSPLCALQLSTA